MRKLLFFGLLTASLFAQNFTIQKADSDSIEINSQPINKGVSAIVIHRINDSFEMIVARALVVNSAEGKVTLSIKPFKDLSQEALPHLNTHPVVGDTVVVPWLYQRSLLVTPTLSSYSTLSASQSGVTFIHPDIFAAHLSKEGHPSPLKADFQDFCRQYDVGLLQFAVKSTLYKVDCNSFAVVGKEKIGETSGKQQLPFYSRIKEIDADWWGEGSDPVKDYEKYYLKLLGENDA